MDWIDETMKRLPHEILDTIGRSGEEQTFRLLRGDAAPIGRLEEEIGCALPGDYREFVRRYGGASLDDCVMLPATDHPELDDMVSVSNFFGLYDGNAAEDCPQDVRYHYHSHHGLLPRGMAPIAGSGDIAERDGQVSVRVRGRGSRLGLPLDAARVRGRRTGGPQTRQEHWGVPFSPAKERLTDAAGMAWQALPGLW